MGYKEIPVESANRFHLQHLIKTIVKSSLKANSVLHYNSVSCRYPMVLYGVLLLLLIVLLAVVLILLP